MNLLRRILREPVFSAAKKSKQTNLAHSSPKEFEIIMENLDKFQVHEPQLVPVTPKENLASFSALSIGEVRKIVREFSNAFLSFGSCSYMTIEVLS